MSPQRESIDFDFDALMQREPRRTTKEQYLEKLSRERAYLQDEADKLAGRVGRQSAIRVELREALEKSHAALEAIRKGDWFTALEIRDRMHIQLHTTKKFQWAPDLQKAQKFPRGRRLGAISDSTKHIRALVTKHPKFKAKKLRKLADERILDGMTDSVFANNVSKAKKALGLMTKK